MNRQQNIKSISLVIPIYNNGKTLKKQLEQCEKILKSICRHYEIIIGEDKSFDNTKQILLKLFSKRKNYRIIFNNRNLGIATNIYQLYKKAHYDYCVLFSVDGGWNPSDIKKLIEASCRQQADIVIGKRDKKKYGLKRRIISFFYNFLPFIFFGVHTYDVGSIKVIKTVVLKKIPIQSKSVFFEAELIIKAHNAGYKITYCPVDFKKGKSDKSGPGFNLISKALLDLISLKLTFIRQSIYHSR